MKCSHEPSHSHRKSLVSPIRIWGNSQWMTTAGVPDSPRGEAGCPVNGHNKNALNKIESQDQKNYIMGQMLGCDSESAGQVKKVQEATKRKQGLNYGFLPQR